MTGEFFTIPFPGQILNLIWRILKHAGNLKKEENKLIFLYLPASPTNTSTGVLVGLSPIILYAVINTSYLLYFFNSEKVKYYIILLHYYRILFILSRLHHLFITRLLSCETQHENSTMMQHLLPSFLNLHITAGFA